MYDVDEIAQKFDLSYVGDGNCKIQRLCGVSDDLPDALSFVNSAKFVRDAERSNIPAFVTRESWPVAGKINLFHADPEYLMALIAGLFEPIKLTQEEAIHATAVIDPSAKLGTNVRVAAHAVVGANVTIGDRSTILASTVIMDRAQLGAACLIHPHVVIREDCVLGDRVIVQPGAVIGSDGYGYVEHEQRHVKIPQLGNVEVEDDCEIGSNVTIDRGRFTATRIGRGTKVDNLVMVAHNVRTGEDCLLVSQTGISGSSRLGDRVTLAGQVGLVGHISVCDDVTVLGQSMVTKNINTPGAWAGSPARPAERWRRAIARLYAGLDRE